MKNKLRQMIQRHDNQGLLNSRLFSLLPHLCKANSQENSSLYLQAEIDRMVIVRHPLQIGK